MNKTPIAIALATAALVPSGCGSSSSNSSSKTVSSPTPTAAATPTAPPPAGLQSAEHPTAAGFPAVKGRSLQDFAQSVAQGTAALGAATGTYTPGTRRLAFALNTPSGGFVYGPTAIYFARTPTSPAHGPILAPADPMTVAAQYQSKQNAGPGGILAIYSTDLVVSKPGTYAIAAVTQSGGKLIVATGEIAVAAVNSIPDVSQPAPAIATDTAASVGGKLSLLTTRIPPENMHAVSLKDVLGKQPVALLFSTPQLCVSRVCGPVTDIVTSLQQQFSSRITFIHEEVYVNDDPKQGLRPQLKAFHLQTEPWLFTINRQGRIAARLEGAFGVNAVTQALQAALK